MIFLSFWFVLMQILLVLTGRLQLQKISTETEATDDTQTVLQFFIFNFFTLFMCHVFVADSDNFYNYILIKHNVY